jgi:hypothetical protein
MKIEKLDLNKNITLYKLKYDWKIPKKNLIDKIYKNLKIAGIQPGQNVSNVILKCQEFKEIHNIAFEVCKSLVEIVDNDYIDDNFIYLQNAQTKYSHNKEFHNHTTSLTKKQPIKNDWTYCFYLQLPKNISADDGKISFKDDNENIVMYTPEEGEFIFFKAEENHTPNQTPHAECDRISIVGVFAFNVSTKLNNKYKSVI